MPSSASPGEQQSAAKRLSSALTAFAEARLASQSESRRSLGVGEMDARALAYLHANPGARPSALRGHLGLTSAGVSTLCDRLVGRGIIHRDTDPSDRRASLLTVVVDLDAAPWDRLTEFDRAVVQALDAEPDDASLDRVASLLARVIGSESAASTVSSA